MAMNMICRGGNRNPFVASVTQILFHEIKLMLHLIQSCQTTYHSQERQYAHWNYREHKDFITILAGY
jgi:hypothetical protein